MKLFAKIVNGLQPLTIFAKPSILGVWQDSESTSDCDIQTYINKIVERYAHEIIYYFMLENRDCADYAGGLKKTNGLITRHLFGRKGFYLEKLFFF